VGGVACESSADMVVDPPGCHRVERAGDHLQRATVPCSPVATEEQGKPCRRGKFRRVAESAMALIEILAELRDRFIQQGNTDGDRGGRFDITLQSFGQLARLICEVGGVRRPGFCNLLEQAGESRAAITIVWREIGAGKERLLIRREEYGHGPSTLS